MLTVYLGERARAASWFDNIKSGYVRWAHERGDTAKGRALLARGAAAPLSSWTAFRASQLAICDLPRMIEVDVPWWNRQAALAVDRFLAEREAPRVFEFGSGASTVWLARRAAHVVSAEPFQEWADALAPRLEPYGDMRLVVRPVRAGGGPFAESIAEVGGQYDLIVVDGRERVACLHRALPHLAPGGMILFDDSARPRYRAGIREALTRSGLRETRHFGPAFAKPYPDHTSIIR